MERKLRVGITIIVFLASIIAIGYYVSQANFTPKPIQSFSGNYLQYNGTASRIFVVSANATYGKYPFPTATDQPLLGSPTVIAKNGEPCVIINVTFRNDYSYQNPAPNNPVPDYNSTLTYVAFTAHLFSGETQISAKDITNAFALNSTFTNKAFTSLSYGDSATLSIYLATNETDITSFQPILYYVGLFPPP